MFSKQTPILNKLEAHISAFELRNEINDSFKMTEDIKKKIEKYVIEIFQ